MSLFTSKLEKKLWMATLAVMAAIYSTLGLARDIASSLIQREKLDEFYILCFLIIVVIIFTNGIKGSALWRVIWIGLGVTAAYAMIFVRMGIGAAERTHLFEYGLVGVLIYHALLERKQNGKAVFTPPVLAFFFTVILGCIDELIQAFIPSRVFDLRDILFNTVAPFIAIAISVIVRWAQGYVLKWRARDSLNH